MREERDFFDSVNLRVRRGREVERFWYWMPPWPFSRSSSCFSVCVVTLIFLLIYLASEQVFFRGTFQNNFLPTYLSPTSWDYICRLYAWEIKEHDVPKNFTGQKCGEFIKAPFLFVVTSSQWWVCSWRPCCFLLLFLIIYFGFVLLWSTSGMVRLMGVQVKILLDWLD